MALFKYDLHALFVALSAALCPSGWFKKLRSCYKLSENVLNWQAAKNACEDLNSTLAIISSHAEHKALITHINGTKKNTWIGLHRNTSDKNGWLWVDGSRLNYTDWGKNEPNNRAQREECVEIRMRPAYPNKGRWNDQECSDAINYICEKGKEDRACDIHCTMSCAEFALQFFKPAANNIWYVCFVELKESRYLP